MAEMKRLMSCSLTMIVLAMFVVKSSEETLRVKYSPRWNPVFHHIRNMPSAGFHAEGKETPTSEELDELKDMPDYDEPMRVAPLKRQADTFSQNTLRQLILLDRLLQNGK